MNGARSKDSENGGRWHFLTITEDRSPYSNFGFIHISTKPFRLRTVSNINKYCPFYAV